jgi:hypothetical protein
VTKKIVAASAFGRAECQGEHLLNQNDAEGGTTKETK